MNWSLLIVLVIAFIFILLVGAFVLLCQYWSERLAARAWWEEQTRAERKIDKRFGF